MCNSCRGCRGGSGTKWKHTGVEPVAAAHIWSRCLWCGLLWPNIDFHTALLELISQLWFHCVKLERKKLFPERLMLFFSFHAWNHLRLQDCFIYGNEFVCFVFLLQRPHVPRPAGRHSEQACRCPWGGKGSLLLFFKPLCYQEHKDFPHMEPLIFYCGTRGHKGRSRRWTKIMESFSWQINGINRPGWGIYGFAFEKPEVSNVDPTERSSLYHFN